jgi:hypothetical protein
MDIETHEYHVLYERINGENISPVGNICTNNLDRGEEDSFIY